MAGFKGVASLSLSLSLGRAKEGQCEDWEGAEVCPRVRGVNIEKAA